MAQPYVGEIRMFAGNFAPAGWMFCEGQLLPISENETLFQLIGTTYGGDGESTFALPDLRGPHPDPPGQRLHPGRDRRRGGDHADGQADPRTRHPLLASNDIRRQHAAQQPRPAQLGDVSAYGTGRSPTRCRPKHRRPVGRQPAAHQLPAVPLRRLHHLAVRDLPVADLGGAMADPFVAEIRIFPFNFAPKGWAWCDGQLLPLSQNTALFSLLGTTYGGNGKSNFALPDLQGRAPMHPGQGRVCAARPRRDRRERDGDAARERDPRAQSHGGRAEPRGGAGLLAPTRR